MTSAPDLSTPEALDSLPTPRRAALLLATLAILVPGGMAVDWGQPLLVRGLSAIASGSALLLGGSYLLGQGFEYLARRQVANQG